MSILDLDIIKGYIRMCTDGWNQGWHERNGGNLTYRMKDEEVAQCRPYFRATPGEWVNMGVQADNLAGEYFITTGSGKYFRNVELDPEHNMGIVMNISDQVTVMRLGRKLVEGTPAIVRNDPEVQRAYLGNMITGDMA